VKALSPIYRALFKEEMDPAGLLAQIAPRLWTIPWNVHSQANHNGHSAFTSLAPYVLRGTALPGTSQGQTVCTTQRRPCVLLTPSGNKGQLMTGAKSTTETQKHFPSLLMTPTGRCLLMG
jgi:hypothetical protein